MIEISVYAPDAINAQLVSDHIGQYLSNTGFTNVTVDRGAAPHIAEPTTQSEALQAIRSLNPGLFNAAISIMPDIGSSVGLDFPDGPESD